MERLTAQRKPCPCGAGEIRVDVTYQDSDWGMSDQSWEGVIDCGHCEPQYGFVGAGRGVDLVRIDDKTRSDALRAEAAECESALLISAAVAAAIQKLAAEMDALPTMAAKYRLAHQLKIESATLPTFRKHVRGVPAARWLGWRFSNGPRAGASLFHLIPVMDHATGNSQLIKDCLAKTKDLRRQAFEALKPVMSLGPISMLAALGGRADAPEKGHCSAHEHAPGEGERSKCL